MITLTVNLPNISGLEPSETMRFIAAKLYEAGRLSLGHAAELAGMSKVAFAEILADYGVSLINYSAEDAARDAEKI